MNVVFNRSEREMWQRGDKASAVKACRDRIKPMPSLQECVDAGERGDFADDFRHGTDALLMEFHGLS